MRLPGSMPDPVETLSTRRLTRSAKTMIPPPIGRSPAKTFLGSSPRRSRSMGPQSISKPAMRPPNTPSRDSPGPSVKRRLDFTKDDPIPSTEASPISVRQSIEKPRNGSVESRKRSHDQSLEEDASLPTVVNGHANSLQDGFPDVYDNQPIFDEGPAFDEGNSIQAVEYVEQEPAEPPAKRKRGRPRKSDQENAKPKADGSFVARLSWSAKKGLEQDGVDRTPGGGVPARLIDPSILEPESPSATVRKNARYRPTHDDDQLSDAEEEDNQPGALQRGKKQVNVHRDTQSADPRPPKGSRKGRKPASKSKAPVERDPNARLASVVSAQDEDAESDAPAKQPERNRRARSLQVLRQGTPAEEPETRKTRYGRTSVKPVDWWRGERVDRQWDGTIENVIRAEDVVLPKRAQKRRGAAAAKRAMSSVPEEEEEKEEWEMDPGLLTGFVATWDEEAGAGIEDDEREERRWSRLLDLTSRPVVASLGRTSLTPYYRNCLRLDCIGNTRCGWLQLPLHQMPESPVLWRGSGGSSTGRIQTSEELPAHADDVLRAFWQSGGTSGGLGVQYQQRRRLASSPR
jgi:centromere protein C